MTNAKQLCVFMNTLTEIYQNSKLGFPEFPLDPWWYLPGFHHDKARHAAVVKSPAFGSSPETAASVRSVTVVDATARLYGGQKPHHLLYYFNMYFKVIVFR